METRVDESMSPTWGLRCVMGGVLMGLANLVPGISGGTMLLAAGIYPRFIQALADLSESRQLVRETDELAERVTAALSAPNRVSVFSDLRRQRERTTGLRNRAARARGADSGAA